MEQETKSSDSERQIRAARLDRIYRRISRLDDDTLAQLDRLTDTAGAIEFYVEPEKTKTDDGHRGQVVNRRAFFVTLLLGGIAAASGGAVWLLGQEGSADRQTPAPASTGELSTATEVLSTPTMQGAPLADYTPSPTPGPPPDVLIDNLRDQLTEARSERIALRAALDAARDEADRLRDQLQRAQNDIVFLQQVIDLYEQLEAVGLDDTIAVGMEPVGLALLTIGSGRNLLEAGIQQAARLLATIEVQSPTIATGLLWLEEQINILARTLQDLEDALSDFFDPVRPLAEQIGAFIGQVLDALPFGVGQHIRAGLEAVGAILTHIPELVASVNPMLITPLREWVSPDEDKGLVAEVVNPINENLIASAQRMVDETATLQTTYESQLRTPVENALATRRQIRQTLAGLTGAA